MSLSKVVLFSILFGNFDIQNAAAEQHSLRRLRGSAKSVTTTGARILETDDQELDSTDDDDVNDDIVDLSSDNNDDNHSDEADTVTTSDSNTDNIKTEVKVIELSEAESDLLDYVTNDHALDAAKQVALALQTKCPQVTNEYTGELDIYDGSEGYDMVPSDNACLLIIKELFTEASIKFLRLAPKQLALSKKKNSKRNKRYLKKFGVAGLEAEKIPESEDLIALLQKEFMSVMEESKSALERGEKPQVESSRYVATRDSKKKRKLAILLGITIASFVGFKWAATAVAVMQVGYAVSELGTFLKEESSVTKRQRKKIVRRARRHYRKHVSTGGGFGR